MPFGMICGWYTIGIWSINAISLYPSHWAFRFNNVNPQVSHLCWHMLTWSLSSYSSLHLCIRIFVEKITWSTQMLAARISFHGSEAKSFDATPVVESWRWRYGWRTDGVVDDYGTPRGANQPLSWGNKKMEASWVIGYYPSHQPNFLVGFSLLNHFGYPHLWKPTSL